MKTKDFIKMLQKEDPTGEGYIRMDGGVPKFAESKPGYYDGAYSYIDSDGNYVTSTKGYKIDIICESVDEFVSDRYNVRDPDNLEKIKSKFLFDDGDDRRKIEKLKAVEKYWNEYKEMSDSSFKRALEEMIVNARNGWRWFQNKEIDNNELNPNMHHYYTWKIYDKDGKEKGSNIHNTEAVIYSEQWDRVDNVEMIGYYEWIYVGEYLKRDKRINEILD